MQKRIETRKVSTALTYRLKGNYATIDYGKAWNELMACLGQNGVNIMDYQAEYLNVYLDNPETTPEAERRCDVCITTQDDKTSGMIDRLKLTGDVMFTTIPAGRWMVFTYKGPYEGLGEANREIFGEIVPTLDIDCSRGCSLEKYLNDMSTTAPEDLLTEIWVPIK